MFNNNVAIKPIYFENIDDVFDEKGTTFLSMRKVQWVKEGEEPDVTKAKLELRKFRVTDEGERMDKGFSFLTEKGPSTLAKNLIERGFGETKEILLSLKKRKDFKDSVDHMYDEENGSDTTDGEYFDIRTALLSEDETDKESD